MSDGPLLRISRLHLELRSGRGTVRPLRGVDLDVGHGEVVGLIGESGSGKTLTALSVLGLLPESRSVEGRILWRGRDLVGAPERALRRIRGADVGVVFQDPLSSLHPWHRIFAQVAEAIRAHQPTASRTTARRRALDLLESVGVPAEQARQRPYPHQWSGGMRQRAMLAMALANRPRLLIADEPTTALDVTIQAQILELLRERLGSTGAAALIISHDLSVVSGLADRVAVMDAGRVVETRPPGQLLRDPRHGKTRELVRARPEEAPAPRRPDASRVAAVVLRASGLAVRHDGDTRSGRPVRAVDGVDLALHRGETLGVVGESGCGKSTLARALVGLETPDRGRVEVLGRALTGTSGARLRRLRTHIQIVFQDPLASLNPRRTAAEAVAAPLRAHGRFHRAGGWERVHDLLDRVQLEPGLRDRKPAQLSGGQRQRVGIARALALDPEILVLDEPVTALDASVRNRVLGLLRELQADLGLSIVLIAHDLAVVRSLAHRIAVMYLGRFVEIGPTGALFDRPAHPYTKALLSAIPARTQPDPEERDRPRILLEGEIPDPADPPSGCRFRTRCWKARERCRAEDPDLRALGDRAHACFFPEAELEAG